MPVHVSRRTVPGLRWAVSELTIAVDPPALVSPSSDERAVALLRRARAFGVTSFDVSGARAADRAEHLIGKSLEPGDDDVVVIVGRAPETLAVESGASRTTTEIGDLESQLKASLAKSQHRVAPARVAFLEWTRTGEKGEEALALQAGELALRGDNAPVVVASVRPQGPLPPHAPVVSAEFSLLDREIEDWLASAEPRSTPPAVIARNPFADGRLDGTRFEHSPLRADPGAGPTSLRSLHSEFDPVLRLGFLTEGHRRTLAQAALRYVLLHSWVATAVIPLPPPDRFDEVLGFNQSPELTDSERERIESLK